MRLPVGGALVALVVAGCAPAPPTLLAAPWELAVNGRRAACLQELTVAIPYRSPRTPFHSDKFDLERGAFTPIDDGMGPAGDFHFFFDGRDFFAIANSSGGQVRQLAKAASKPGSAPVRLSVGDRLQLRRGDALYELVITRLDAGTMRLSGREGGSGQGAVTFGWQRV